MNLNSCCICNDDVLTLVNNSDWVIEQLSTLGLYNIQTNIQSRNFQIASSLYYTVHTTSSIKKSKSLKILEEALRNWWG